jgi:hypothetical protein
LSAKIAAAIVEACDMKLSSKIFAGVLLGIGVPISIISFVGMFDRKAEADIRAGSGIILVMFGLPPTAVGGWIIGSGIHRARREERDRLRNTFFRLLEENNGHLTVLRFSMETGLEGQDAKLYLDERAKEFNAAFNVTEEGNFSYYFNLEGSKNLPGS